LGLGNDFGYDRKYRGDAVTHRVGEETTEEGGSSIIDTGNSWKLCKTRSARITIASPSAAQALMDCSARPGRSEPAS
jgi:hypothetical protein